jgi:hypothetical protein
MASSNHVVHVHINQTRYSFEHSVCTGRAIKDRAGIPLDHILCVDLGSHGAHEDPNRAKPHRDEELQLIGDDQSFTLEPGLHFWTHAKPQHSTTVTIDGKEYAFANPQQTGRSLKERAQIPAGDVLFLDRPHEDQVIPDDSTITLKCGECFHSAPPANYGAPPIAATDVGFAQFEAVAQPDGWTFLVVPDFPLPSGYSASNAKLLVKLPPAFPDAAPDMFWLSPEVKTANGGAPMGTSTEPLIGSNWQRFSWHLLPGAWRPGASSLRDYMRCVRARLEKKN